MVVFGLFLLVLAAAVVFVAVWEGGDALGVEAFGFSAETTVWAVFLGGVATGLIALSGIVAVSAGVRRKRAHSREFEYLRQRVAEQDREDDADAERVGEWLGPGQPRGGQSGDRAQVPSRPSPPAPRATPTYRGPHG